MNGDEVFLIYPLMYFQTRGLASRYFTNIIVGIP